MVEYIYAEEWKNDFIPWLYGLANAGGGKFYIGLNKNKEVIGLKDAEKVASEIKSSLTSLGVSIKVLTQKNKKYIEITISASGIPISYGDIFYYFRSGKLNIINNEILVAYMAHKKIGLFPDLPIPPSNYIQAMSNLDIWGDE